MSLIQNDKILIRDMNSLVEFENIFKHYYRQLFFYAYGFVMDEMEAEDIVQETFAIIWERRARLPESLDIQAYLYAAVKYACLKYFRRLKLSDKYHQRQIEAFLLSFAQDEMEENEEIVLAVRRAKEKLTKQQLKIVELHISEGKKYEEIAAILELSENTVRTHLKRAYKILRENLAYIIPNLSLFI